MSRRGLGGLVERELWIADLLRDSLTMIRYANRSLERGVHGTRPERSAGELVRPFLARADISLRGALAELAYLTGPSPR